MVRYKILTHDLLWANSIIHVSMQNYTTLALNKLIHVQLFIAYTLFLCPFVSCSAIKIRYCECTVTDLLWCVGTINTPNFTLLGHYFHSLRKFVIFCKTYIHQLVNWQLKVSETCKNNLKTSEQTCYGTSHTGMPHLYSRSHWYTTMYITAIIDDE